MKTYLFSFFLLLTCMAGYSQTSISPLDVRVGRRITIPLYSDTNAANTGGAARAGSIILTYMGGDRKWVRNYDNTAWVTGIPASGGGSADSVTFATNYRVDTAKVNIRGQIPGLARSAISLTTTGTSGAATYNSGTGVLNVPQYSGGGVTTVGSFQTFGNANAASISGSNIYMHKVSATTPGMLSTGTDTIPGAKRLNGILSASNDNNNNSAKIYLFDSSSLQSGIGGIFQSGGSYMQFHQSQHFGATTGLTGFRWRLGNYSTSISGVGLGQDLMRLTGDGIRLYVPWIGDLNLQTKITFPNDASTLRIQLQDSSSSKFAGIYSRLTLGTPGWNIMAFSIIDRADIGLDNTRNRFDFGRGISASGNTPGNTLYASITHDYSAFNNRVETPTAIIGSTGAPHSSAALEISTTAKGFLPPRMTTTQRNTIPSPAPGLILYDTDSARLMIYTSSAWKGIRHTDQGSGTSSVLTGSDVTIVNAGTWYDAVSLTLPAGTWDLDAQISFTGGAVVIGRIYNGTVAVSSDDFQTPNITDRNAAIHLTAQVTIASNTTYTLQGASSTGSSTARIKYQTGYLSQPGATQIRATRVN